MIQNVDKYNRIISDQVSVQTLEKFKKESENKQKTTEIYININGVTLVGFKNIGTGFEFLNNLLSSHIVISSAQNRTNKLGPNCYKFLGEGFQKWQNLQQNYLRIGIFNTVNEEASQYLRDGFKAWKNLMVNRLIIGEENDITYPCIVNLFEGMKVWEKLESNYLYLSQLTRVYQKFQEIDNIYQQYINDIIKLLKCWTKTNNSTLNILPTNAKYPKTMSASNAFQQLIRRNVMAAQIIQLILDNVVNNEKVNWNALQLILQLDFDFDL